MLISQIYELLKFIVKYIPIDYSKDNPLSPKYQKFTVDILPIIKKPEKLDYKVLIRKHKMKHNKELKPIRIVLLLYLLMLYAFVVALHITICTITTVVVVS